MSLRATPRSAQRHLCSRILDGAAPVTIEIARLWSHIGQWASGRGLPHPDPGPSLTFTGPEALRSAQMMEGEPFEYAKTALDHKWRLPPFGLRLLLCAVLQTCRADTVSGGMHHPHASQLAQKRRRGSLVVFIRWIARPLPLRCPQSLQRRDAAILPLPFAIRTA